MLTGNQYIMHPDTSKYVPAKEAMSLLGISQSTLYSYVSRKLIRSRKSHSNKRIHKYNYDDIVKLLEKKKIQVAETIAQQSLQWGTPVLESSITLIQDNMIFYKGRSIASLVDMYSFEQVATLLWTGSTENYQNLFSEHQIATDKSSINNSLTDIQKLLLDIEKSDLILLLKEDKPTQGGIILSSIVQSITQNLTNETIANKLAQFYCPNEVHASELINTALIVIADHELNASSFTARVVASTEANLFQVIVAGLSALSGYKHGATAFEIKKMVNELNENLTIEKNLLKRINGGGKIIGFGHTLYPNGDIRAKILLNKIKRFYGDTKDYQMMKLIMDKCIEFTDQLPNVDFSLYFLAKLLHQDDEFAIFLFALGRIAGWVAEAIEQYQEDKLIRPRAKYIGIKP